MPTPGSVIPWSNVKPYGASSVDKTPVRCRRLTTPHQGLGMNMSSPNTQRTRRTLA